jgi:hypothetical protein
VRRGNSIRLVYGRVDESLVFIQREIAIELATLWDALGSSSTWGEFRKRISSDRFLEVAKLTDADGDRIPRDDKDFPGYDLPQIADGDYPEWPAQLMLNWVPSETIRASYAKRATSVLNGPVLVLDSMCESAIVSDFRAHGFSVRKDAELVLRASGLSTPTKVPRAVPDLVQRLSSLNLQVRMDAVDMLEEAGTVAVPVHRGPSATQRITDRRVCRSRSPRRKVSTWRSFTPTRPCIVGRRPRATFKSSFESRRRACIA